MEKSDDETRIQGSKSETSPTRNKTIETVTPSLFYQQTEGKQIMNLFDNFKLRIAADMLPTASRPESTKAHSQRHELEELQEAYSELKNPSTTTREV